VGLRPRARTAVVRAGPDGGRIRVPHPLAPGAAVAVPELSARRARRVLPRDRPARPPLRGLSDRFQGTLGLPPARRPRPVRAPFAFGLPAGGGDRRAAPGAGQGGSGTRPRL